MLNILDEYPEANESQKRQLIEAYDKWSNAVMGRKCEVRNNALDGVLHDPFDDITKEFRKSIKRILGLASF